MYDHMEKKDALKVKVILGSIRPGRFSEHPGRWILGIAKQIEGVETELLDLRNYQMPFYEEPVSPATDKTAGLKKDPVKRWSEKIEEADGFIIVTPEYNHGYSAVLKNALDYVWYPWNKKPVAFVAYGNAGGARSVEQLREVAVELEMHAIRRAVHIPSPWNLVGKDNVLKEGAFDPYSDTAKKMLEELVSWTKALKAVRET